MSFDGKPLLAGATLALDVDHVRLGAAARITGGRRQSVDRKLAPPVRLKAESLVEKYNELRLDCAGGYAVVFRAYDQGMAYRFETALPAAQVKVYGEDAVFPFAPDTAAFFPNEGKTFFSHNEPSYGRVRLADIPAGDLATLPVVVESAAGPKLAIAEADVESYPGLWLRATGSAAIAAAFPPFPLEEKAVKDRDVKVVRAADYIAVTTGTRAYPWRVLAVAATDARAGHQLARLPAAATVADRGHVVDQAREGRVGLVERPQPRRRAVQAGDEHRDLQVLHRFRGALRHRIRDPRRGLVQDRRSAAGRARHRHAPAAGVRAREERRHHPVGGVEDAGRSAASRRWRSSNAGASRG